MLAKKGIVVFTPGFLERLSTQEPAPLTSQEATWVGPWLVAAKGEEFIVHRVGDSTPVAFTRYHETARLVAAALPAVGRGPLYWFSAEKSGEHGLFDLLTVLGEKGPSSIGRFDRRHEEILGPLSTVEFLARSPAALSYLIEAASREVLEQADHLIAERLVQTAEGY